jgi:hypothetical protein
LFIVNSLQLTGPIVTHLLLQSAAHCHHFTFFIAQRVNPFGSEMEGTDAGLKRQKQLAEKRYFTLRANPSRNPDCDTKVTSRQVKRMLPRIDILASGYFGPLP